MATYQIIYDYTPEDADYTERNCQETFYGSWSELQDELRIMRQNGRFSNIYATCIDEDDEDDSEW